MSTMRPPIGLLPRRLGWIARLGFIVCLLAIETLLISGLIQRVPLELVQGAPRVVRDVQHWLFRWVIAYGVSLGMLTYLREQPVLTDASAPVGDGHRSARYIWGLAHILLLVPLAALSINLYSDASTQPFAVTAIEWHVCALAAALSLFAAVAPLSVWWQLLRQTSALSLYAGLLAAAAVLSIRLTQHLWAPTAGITFRLVTIILQLLCPSLRSDPATLTLITDHFTVTVSEVCSGLEGVGLIVVFCAAWLCYFRREFYFPRALIIVPLAALLIYFLNAVRIAALVLIGNAGYAQIAMVGFHSQAGWIAFNLVALGVAILARRSPWLHRDAGHAEVGSENATAAYLMPLLAILAAGMVAHALSAGFEFLYPLRFLVAAWVLWTYRQRYRRIDWKCSWRAPALGALMFCVWVLFAHFIVTPSPRPVALASLPGPLGAAWIVCRVLAATLTVPIAEELAYRGYLLRRLVRADFESVSFKEVHWLVLALSAILFGTTHGRMWIPGVIAGWGYGLLAVKTGKLGEAVVAHGTTNLLLSMYVLRFDQWQLW